MKEHAHRSLAKAVTWRIWGTLDTLIISLIVTGHLQTAGAIASLELITGTVGYFFHERIWSLVNWGRHVLHLDHA